MIYQASVKRILTVLLLACAFLHVTPVSAQGAPIQESEFDRRAEHLIDLLTNQKAGYFLLEDTEFERFLNDIQLSPETRKGEVFRILRLAVEHYKALLLETTHTSNVEKIKSHLNQVISKSQGYFSYSSNNEIAIQYFKNLKKMIDSATNPRPQSHKGHISDMLARAQQESSGKQESVANEYEYRRFSDHIRTQSTYGEISTTQLLIEAYKEKNDLYLSSTEIVQKERAFSDLKRTVEHCLRFASATNDQFGRRFFENQRQYLAQQQTVIDRLNSEKEAATERLNFSKRMQHYANEIFAFIDAVGRSNAEKVQLNFLDTTIEVTAKELPVQLRPVDAPALNDSRIREKFFSYRVLGSSTHMADISRLTAEILLDSPYSAGIYFENSSHIPKALTSYVRTDLGSHAILKPNMCARLFL